jgi:hypothetical protein
MRTWAYWSVAAFFATLGFFGIAVEEWQVRSLAGTTVLSDYQCGCGCSSRASHPCSCYQFPGHPQDICAHADPVVTGNPNCVKETSCTSHEGSECTQTPSGTAHDCGDVKACVLYLTGTTTLGPPFVCNTDVDTELYDLVCSPTNKGSCYKTHGSCWPPPM